jgi:hypothetical protein
MKEAAESRTSLGATPSFPDPHFHTFETQHRFATWFRRK